MPSCTLKSFTSPLRKSCPPVPVAPYPGIQHERSQTLRLYHGQRIVLVPFRRNHTEAYLSHQCLNFTPIPIPRNSRSCRLWLSICHQRPITDALERMEKPVGNLQQCPHILFLAQPPNKTVIILLPVILPLAFPRVNKIAEHRHLADIKPPCTVFSAIKRLGRINTSVAFSSRNLFQAKASRNPIHEAIFDPFMQLRARTASCH